MAEQFMRRALLLAEQARGRTSPNPMVGAVIVKDGQIIGEGWHQQAGTPHAEIHALRAAGDAARGADMYVTLEPCCHHGRTGPCTEAVIEAGIKRVVVAMTDPNPQVAGQGLARLRAQGIRVEDGLLAAEAAKLNEVFIKWIATRKPFGVLKTAMTLDGKIATYTGSSQWITGPAARRYVHQLRSDCDAVLTGIGTVLADDPALTARIPGGKNPTRIVLDSMARTPLQAQLLTDQAAPVIIAVTEQAPTERRQALQQAGAEVIVLPGPAAQGIDLAALFTLLGERSLTSILIEGGAKINAAAIQANVVDKVAWFIAPKLVGGQAAPGPVGGPGLADISNAYRLEDMSIKTIEQDMLVTGYLSQREGRDVYRTCGRIGDNPLHT